MEEAVFVGQYTFLVTPQVFEEEERILGKIVRRNDKITFEGKKISNAVYRFKSGEETDLFVKLFSIAASRIRVIQENRHRAVLIPVPASTRAKHRTRYEAFCHRLSADMGVADGYGRLPSLMIGHNTRARTGTKTAPPIWSSIPNISRTNVY